jgi:glycosyltransferase involved in cell wall biosynthesis
MSAKVFVVIVTYNGSKWVTTCFSSLRPSTVPLHTIVIDNGSQDDTLARIAAGYPEVEIVSTGQNHGFGKANNIGMERAYQRGAAAACRLCRRAPARVNIHMDTGKPFVLPGKHNITASYECSITRITTVRAIQIR